MDYENNVEEEGRKGIVSLRLQRKIVELNIKIKNLKILFYLLLINLQKI